MSKHAEPDHRPKMNKRFVAGGVAAALGLGLFAATPVVAQEAPSAEQAPSGDAPDRPRLGRFAQRRSALAGALGIDVEALDAAVRAAHDQVVADLGHAERPMDPEQARTRHDAFTTALAVELGIDVADLRAARREVLADELGDAVAEGRLTQDEADEMLRAFDDGTLPELLRERREARLEERLADAVDQGRITQEDADEMLDAIDNGTLREYFEARREAGERPALPLGFGGRRGPLGTGALERAGGD